MSAADTTPLTPAPSPQTRPPRRRWLWALLIISLALNLLVVGAIGGAVWAVKRGGMWDAPSFAVGAFQFMHSLPPEKRAELRAIFKVYRPKLHPLVQDLRQARRNFLTALRAEPFDESALEKAYRQLTERETRLRTAALPMFAEAFKVLQPEQRVRLLLLFIRGGVTLPRNH